MTDYFKIADGRDNTAGLLPLHQLSVPLFDEYVAAEAVFTEWHSWEEQLIDGNRQPVAIGLPYIKAVFFRLTRAEYAYLVGMFGPPVTIHVLNKDGNAYDDYNATMVVKTGEQKWDRQTGTGFEEVEIEFRDLEAA